MAPEIRSSATKQIPRRGALITTDSVYLHTPCGRHTRFERIIFGIPYPLYLILPLLTLPDLY